MLVEVIELSERELNGILKSCVSFSRVSSEALGK